MAKDWTEKWVSALAGGGGTGAEGDPYTLAEMSAQATNNVAYYIKSDGTYTPAATIGYTGTPSSSAPVAFIGLNAAGNPSFDFDDMPLFDGGSLPGGNSIWHFSTKDYVWMHGLELKDGPSNGVVGDDQTIISFCNIHDNALIGIDLDSNSRILFNKVQNNGNKGVVLLSGLVFGNLVTGNASEGVDLPNLTHCMNNYLRNNQISGASNDLQIGSGSYQTILFNTIIQTPDSEQELYGFGGSDGTFALGNILNDLHTAYLTGANQNVFAVAHNVEFNNTNRLATATSDPAIDENNQTTDPAMVDPANDDYDVAEAAYINALAWGLISQDFNYGAWQGAAGGGGNGGGGGGGFIFV